MAKRYRYAFAKKKEAQKGKLSTVLAAVSFVLFVIAVLLAFWLQGSLRIYDRRDQPFRNAAVGLRIYYGTSEFF